MNGDQIRKVREQQSWSQKELAETLNAALDRKYSSSVVSQWENGKRPVPDHVGVFLAELGLGVSPEEQPRAEPPPAGGDLPPEYGEPPRPQSPIVPLSDNPYSRVCTELWEMVATGIGMTGAALGSEALKRDGLIIDADKESLGKAWGKLAMTNATFRHMLEGMSTSTAWLEVLLVTGKTVGTCWRNHQDLRTVDGTGTVIYPVEPDQPDGFAEAA